MEIPCPGRQRMGTLLIVLLVLALHVRPSDSTFLWTRLGPPQSPFSGDPPSGWRPPALVPDAVLPPPTTTNAMGGVPKEPQGYSQDLLRLPQILCGYAATGRWPPYPPYLQPAIVDLGRHVFALDDLGVRQYCAKYTRIAFVRRPCCAFPVYPIYIMPGGGRTTTEASVDTDVVTGITSVPDAADEMPDVGGGGEDAGGGEEETPSGETPDDEDNGGEVAGDDDGEEGEVDGNEGEEGEDDGEAGDDGEEGGAEEETGEAEEDGDGNGGEGGDEEGGEEGGDEAGEEGGEEGDEEGDAGGAEEEGEEGEGEGGDEQGEEEEGAEGPEEGGEQEEGEDGDAEEGAEGAEEGGEGVDGEEGIEEDGGGEGGEEGEEVEAEGTEGEDDEGGEEGTEAETDEGGEEEAGAGGEEGGEEAAEEAAEEGVAEEESAAEEIVESSRLITDKTENYGKRKHSPSKVPPRVRSNPRPALQRHSATQTTIFFVPLRSTAATTTPGAIVSNRLNLNAKRTPGNAAKPEKLQKRTKRPTRKGSFSTGAKATKHTQLQISEKLRNNETTKRSNARGDNQLPPAKRLKKTVVVTPFTKNETIHAGLKKSGGKIRRQASNGHTTPSPIGTRETKPAKTTPPTASKAKRNKRRNEEDENATSHKRRRERQEKQSDKSNHTRHKVTERGQGGSMGELKHK